MGGAFSMTDEHSGAIGRNLADRRQRDRENGANCAGASFGGGLGNTACSVAKRPELGANWQLYRSIAKQFLEVEQMRAVSNMESGTPSVNNRSVEAVDALGVPIQMRQAAVELIASYDYENAAWRAGVTADLVR